MADYNPIKIEERWRKRWEKEGTFKINIKGAKKPYYNLMMFPYPSAEGLHIGNVYAFTGSDIHGRYMRMRGFDVFEPIGFDSFGIHSENFAIKKGEHPKDLTQKNIEHFREDQLKRMGNIFDWDYEVITSDPSYYKWTQWLFLQLYRAGLAYRAKAPVDWCPSCKTVLADEQVIAGRCERCGSEVIQRELEQWFLKITDYAEKLLSNLDIIDWSEVIKTAQRNWIGKSIGAEIEFPLLYSSQTRADFTQKNADVPSESRNNVAFNAKGRGNENLQRNSASVQRHSATLTKVKVFTTRSDTLFGATYVVLAPENALVEQMKEKIENWDEVQKYKDSSKKKTELERTDLAKEKTGIELKGIKAINPANEEEIPVWIADYVLAGYGTGAIMAVPAHDQRDFEFAKKYNLPIKMVICPNYPEKNCPVLDEAYEGEGHLVDSGELTGTHSEEAKEKITEFVGGEKKVNYHLRDWLISRQRYWGPPIPVIYCSKCREIRSTKFEIRNTEGVDYIIIDGKEYAIVPVPEEDLPVELPYVEEFRPTGTDKSPLATVEEFVKTKCPECGGEARRETDVSDTFLDSSWYYLGYLSNLGNKKSKIKNKKYKSKSKIIPWDPELIKKWCPVDMYIGGKEHAVLHLMYARFITMALHDMAHIDFEEPFKKFRAHGLLIREGTKMSKSKGNVINPEEYFDSYGADVLRMYLMFLGPYEQGGDWQDAGIAGVQRFLKRVWRLVNDYVDESKSQNFQIFNFHNFQTNSNNKNSKLEKLAHKTIKKVTEDIESLQYNTAIAALMKFVNEIMKYKSVVSCQLSVVSLLKLLAPFAPHITEELWRETLGNKTSIHSEPWPEYDEKYLVEDKVIIIIQINGKVRGQVEVETGSNEEKIKELALQAENITRWLEGRDIKKTIYVQDRLINFVV